MRAALLNTPTTPAEWDRFALDNRASHQIINKALIGQGVQPVDYIIYPIDESNFQSWLLQHSLMHQQMDGTTGNTSQDFSILNPSDLAAVTVWMQQHAYEHYAVEQALGVAS